MTSHPSDRPVSALRARMIEDMRVRGFSEKTRNDYIRNVRAFAAFIGRSPDTATAEDLRRFQHHQSQTGVRPAAAAEELVRVHQASFRRPRGGARLSRTLYSSRRNFEQPPRRARRARGDLPL